MASRYAEENGLELDEKFTYKDLGVSAFDRSNLERGVLGLFLQAAKEGKVPKGSVLLVEPGSRVGWANGLIVCPRGLATVKLVGKQKNVCPPYTSTLKAFWEQPAFRDAEKR